MVWKERTELTQENQRNITVTEARRMEGATKVRDRRPKLTSNWLNLIAKYNHRPKKSIHHLNLDVHKPISKELWEIMLPKREGSV